MADNQKTYTLTNDETGVSVKLPVRESIQGPPAIDVSALYKDAGVFTYDPGFMSTASCKSKITFIQGEVGILEYRGYPIEQLAANGDFLETAYLLLNGELPNEGQLRDFNQLINRHTMLNETLTHFFDGFHYNAHPMAIMVGVVGSLSAFYHDSLDINDPELRRVAAHRLIAKMPTIAAASYKHNVGEPFMYPRNELSYCANLLHMMFATPCEEYEVDPVAEKA
ncbi:MAG: citrate/2-methylcitrate synthase, partial [Candidatus Thiodiazotropha endolucinida]